jgi:hypothetical protein
MLRASARPSTPMRGGWLALALSLGLHALLLTILSCLPAGSLQADRSPPLVTTVVVCDEADDGPDTAAPTRSHVAPSSIEPEPPPPQIQPITINETPPPVPESTPMVQAATTADPAGGTQGTGAYPAGGGLGAGTADAGLGFFQVAAQGTSLVYVLDCSSSMGLNGCFADARRELLASLERLPESAHFQVICYNRDAVPLSIGGRTDLVPAAPENKQAAAEALEAVRPAGGTCHLEALRQALALEPDVVFWVTDAADLTLEQVRVVTAWNHGRTAIHAIELGGNDPGGPDTPLSQLARYNRGTYSVVAPAGGN